MMEQDKYVQDADLLVSSDILDCLIRNFMQNPIKEEEKFVEKEEYLNQLKMHLNALTQDELTEALQYYSDYLNEVGTLDKDPKTPEQESLRNKYLISYSGSQLVNLYYKMISLEPKASNRASLIKEKDKMVQDFMDYFDDNEN